MPCRCHIQALSRVEVDGRIVKADTIASELLTASSCRVELFDASAPPPTAEQIAASAPPPPAAAKTAPAAAPAPAAAAAPKPKPAATAAPIPAGTPAASNTMPVCKYGLACRIISPKEECTTKSAKEQQHWFKFQHPCYCVHAEGHPELGPPGIKVPLHTRFGMHGVYGRGIPCPPCTADFIVPCDNFDPDHRRCFRHPEDDPEVVVADVDEAADDLDAAVVTGEVAWEVPDVGEVGEEQAMEAKMEAAEAAGNGEHEKAVAAYSTALKAMPSALMYAKRAESLLKLGRPAAAVADCDRALEVNPDSGKAYKVAAKAYTQMGEWDLAYARVCTYLKIDYEDDAAELQKLLQACRLTTIRRTGRRLVVPVRSRSGSTGGPCPGRSYMAHLTSPYPTAGQVRQGQGHRRAGRQARGRRRRHRRARCCGRLRAVRVAGARPRSAAAAVLRKPSSCLTRICTISMSMWVCRSWLWGVCLGKLLISPQTEKDGCARAAPALTAPVPPPIASHHR